MNTMTTPVLKPTELYLGDNGRCFCGEHAGCSAKYTGRDISGQKVFRLTEKLARAEKLSFRCEAAGCTVTRGVW